MSETLSNSVFTTSEVSSTTGSFVFVCYTCSVYLPKTIRLLYSQAWGVTEYM